MRAGTTWLTHNLRRHPRIWIGQKEVHFFDRKLESRRFPLLGRDPVAQLRYAVRFLGGRLRNRISGEVTPRYAILDSPVIARIHAWMPDLRLILILRDPVERAWSQARLDFPNLYQKSAGQASPAELIRFFDSESVRLRNNYAANVRSWLGVFDRAQLLVLFLEEARTDPARVLRDAWTFLGVDPDAHVDWNQVSRPVNAGEVVPMPDWARRHLDDAYGDQAELERLIGRPVAWSR
jgi:hypothetical protein